MALIQTCWALYDGPSIRTTAASWQGIYHQKLNAIRSGANPRNLSIYRQTMEHKGGGCWVTIGSDSFPIL